MDFIFKKILFAQAKIVEVLNGKAIDVVVDMRLGSPTYGKSTEVLLMPYNKDIPESGRQLFVPRGFMHGFISLEDNTLFQYIIDNDYALKWKMEFFGMIRALIFHGMICLKNMV